MASVISSGHFFYGLLVGNSTLFLAADSEDKLKGLQVIDEIIYRRDKGSSITTIEAKASISEIPSEIWSEIRRQVIFSAVAETERETVARLRCDTESNRLERGASGGTYACTNPKHGENAKKLACLMECTECSSNLASHLWSIRDGDVVERKPQITRLLKQFGLRSDDVSPITSRREDYENYTSSELNVVEFSYTTITTLESKSQELKENVHIADVAESYEDSTCFPHSLFIDTYNNRVEIQKRFDRLFESYKIKPYTSPRNIQAISRNEHATARWILRTDLYVEVDR